MCDFSLAIKYLLSWQSTFCTFQIFYSKHIYFIHDYKVLEYLLILQPSHT